MLLKIEFEYRRRKVRNDCLNIERRDCRLQPIENLKPRKIAVCQCDTCNIEFKILNHVTKKSKQKYHFCCVDCKARAQKHGGQLYNAKPTIINADVLKSAKFASHTADANRKRVESQRAYYADHPEERKKFNTPAACLKRHETMKKNKTYRTSRCENELFDYLVSKYGSHNIERNKLVNSKWPIDFYVKSTNTYIQLDGVYWHGLDRSIDDIAKYKTKRDFQIHKKWNTDREQDAWFSSNNEKLFRITDVQFLNGKRP